MLLLVNVCFVSSYENVFMVLLLINNNNNNPALYPIIFCSLSLNITSCSNSLIVPYEVHLQGIQPS